jgi:hypothetical protein
MAANLTYYIFEGELIGTAANRMWNVTALSGGGGGSRVNPTDGNTNNPYAQGVKTEDGRSGHRHGGPIPVGRYRIATPSRHAHLGLSARLDPYDEHQERAMMGRDGFYIHGRGRHGSDGCIVPMEQFQELMAALTTERGGILFVLEAMGGARFV